MPQAAHLPSRKSLQIERADARTRTGDPFITSEVLYQLSYVGTAKRPGSSIAAARRFSSAGSLGA
jgi:hypothetical protein